MRTHSIALLGLTVISAPLTGQTLLSTDRIWDKATSIEYALANNTDLGAAKLMIDIAESRLDQTGVLPNPSLELNYANDFAYNNEGEDNFSVGFSQSFPLANRLRKAKAVSRVDIAKAKMEVRQLEISIVESISAIVLEIQIADNRRRSLERLLSSNREIASFIESRIESGEYSQLDANQAKLDALSLEQAINQLNDERSHLTHSLAPLLGLPPETEIEFAESDDIDPMAPLPAYDPDLFERHPEFQLATLDAFSAEAEIALAQSENWEDITAQVFWQNERSVDEPFGLGTDRLVGLKLSLPLPLRKKGDLRANEQRIAQDQARRKAASIKLRVLHEVEHAHHEVEDLQASLASFKDNVITLANTQFEEMRSAYREGQVSFLEFLRTQSQLRDLENDYLDTLESFARARLKLELSLLAGPGLENK